MQKTEGFYRWALVVFPVDAVVLVGCMSAELVSASLS